jgi:hypothetical protein
VRVLDHLLFMNSKTLFKVRARVEQHAASRTSAALTACRRAPRQFQRKDPVGKNRKPVMVHINYHPDKACINAAPHTPALRAPHASAHRARAVGAHEGGHPSLGGRRHACAGQFPGACRRARALLQSCVLPRNRAA